MQFAKIAKGLQILADCSNYLHLPQLNQYSNQSSNLLHKASFWKTLPLWSAIAHMLRLNSKHQNKFQTLKWNCPFICILSTTERQTLHLPIEAAANGFGWKSWSLVFHSGPNWSTKTLSICRTGMKSADSRTRSKILCNWGLIIVLSWMLNIWPNFKAAPRTLHSVLTMRSALASVRNGLESRMAAF